ncbi:hypothetical protein JYU34_012192 [Plutella xylostella]|uniref:Uncharacterized protein n=1 Tax=Plutella xylostella TaxID=51655 RepID=A0ABQ7QF07_PLUXY|nr:uncharacterized protein LOC105381874 [Plutella xylostella]KAG7303650.1 hypothetical protein JYU34_012192 [Plutella xylostella]
MPPTKDQGNKYNYTRSFSNNEMSMSARVYHPATNLMPPSPPISPTGIAPSFNTKYSPTSTFGRQNSQSNSKYSS